MNAEDIKPQWVGMNLLDGDMLFEIQFNCEECTHDWKAFMVLPSDTELHPIFWG
jgi:hypothetical protein